MVPGQLSLSDVSKTKELIVGLQEETAAAPTTPLMISGTLWRGEQLKYLGCKHRRGPDVDCTHSKHRSRKPGKTVPSADS